MGTMPQFKKLTRGRLRYGIGAALLSAGLLALSFPGASGPWLAFIALVPLFITIHHAPPARSFLLCFITGFAATLGISYWINHVDWFGWVHYLVFGIYLASYWGIFGALFSLLSRSRVPVLLAAPTLWVSLELIRSDIGILAWPWALLGHTQYLNLPLIQIASFTGAYGVSFVLLVTNVALADLLLRQREALVPALVAAGIVAGTVAYGIWVLSAPERGERFRVSVIQGNIAQDIKWQKERIEEHLQKHITLTRDAVRDRPSLVVWPETSVQTYLTSDLRMYDRISRLARELSIALIVGSDERPKFGGKEFKLSHSLNSAYLFSAQGKLSGTYHKQRLVPFGEYLPLADALPWPERLRESAPRFVSGNEDTVLLLTGTGAEDIRFGVLICWEDMFPGLFRRFVDKGARFMVNITNEAWFSDTTAPYHFLAMSVFRAVENRVSVVRASNTGVSGFIDPHGRIMGRVMKGGKDTFVAGYSTLDVQLSSRRSVYTSCGDVFAYLDLGLSILLVMRAAVLSRFTSPSPLRA